MGDDKAADSRRVHVKTDTGGVEDETEHASPQSGLRLVREAIPIPVTSSSACPAEVMSSALGVVHIGVSVQAVIGVCSLADWRGCPGWLIQEGG